MKIIVLDLGGTFIKAALMDEKANIIDRMTAPSPTDCLDNLLIALDKCIEPFKKDADGIAISMPGRIDAKNGIACTGGAYFYIRNLELARILEERYNLPVTMDNDGKCAANAENWIGSLQDVSSGFVYVFGTGIGGGIVIDNKVHRGFHYAAAELSCNLIHKDGYANSDNHVCLYGSTTGLLDEYKKNANLEEKVDGVEFFKRANGGDEIALKTLREFCKFTANSFYDLQIILDLERFAIGGGISAQPILLQTIQEEIDKIWDTEYPLPCIKPEIVVCKFGNDANLIGALKHFLDNKGA